MSDKSESFFTFKNESLEDVYNKINSVGTVAKDSVNEADAAQRDANDGKSETKTRNNLTLYFILGFFGMLILSALFVLWYNSYIISWAIELKDKDMLGSVDNLSLLQLDKVLSIIISALGTSLGFIIGYYFKNK